MNLLQKEAQAPASPHSFTCRACPNLQVGFSLQTGSLEKAELGHHKSAGGIDPSGSLDGDLGAQLKHVFLPFFSIEKNWPFPTIIFFSMTHSNYKSFVSFSGVYSSPAKHTRENSIRAPTPLPYRQFAGRNYEISDFWF